MIKRRPIEVFSLSFLDCLCCGFGAILLLFILTIGTGPHGLDGELDLPNLENMRTELASLEADVADKAARLDAAINREQISQERARILSEIQEQESTLADLRQEYESIQANLSTAQQSAAAANRILQSFKHEDLPPIGLPTDATHIVFVIDTSGSMRNRLTRHLHTSITDLIGDLLDNLPEVTSMQFVDASGDYMLPDRSGYWLPDTPGLRQQLLQEVLRYPGHSVSHPLPGMRRAIRDLKPQVGPDDRMSIYVIGDDFRSSVSSFLIPLDRLNPRDPSTGKRPISINAVGFPTMMHFYRSGSTHGNIRYANAMRETVEEHGGVLILKPGI